MGCVGYRTASYSVAAEHLRSKRRSFLYLRSKFFGGPTLLFRRNASMLGVPAAKSSMAFVKSYSRTRYRGSRRVSRRPPLHLGANRRGSFALQYAF